MMPLATAPGIVGLAFAALLAGSSVAVAQPLQPIDRESSGNFTAIAIVTSDIGWYDLFRRPETPHIRDTEHFAAGQTGALAIIFSNAKPRDGKIKVECDVTAFDPKGSSTVVDGGTCYEGPYFGDGVLHPALLDVRFDIGPNDPPGRAGFKVTLRDAQSGRRVNLEVGFVQGASK
jgi:hypothetical protein